MFYHVSRLILTVLIFLIALYILIRKKEQLIGGKKAAVIVPALLVILVIRLPIESLFISFSSPEAIFRHYELGNVYEVAEGRESCLVISKRRSGVQLAFYPRSDKGYKVDLSISGILGISGVLRSELIKKEEKGSILFMLYEYKNTGDYYLLISGSSEKEKHNVTFNTNDSTDFVGEKERMYGPEQYDMYDIDKIFYISDLKELRNLKFDGEKVPIPERVFTS